MYCIIYSVLLKQLILDVKVLFCASFIKNSF